MHLFGIDFDFTLELGFDFELFKPPEQFDFYLDCFLCFALCLELVIMV